MSKPSPDNLFEQQSKVTPTEREALFQQKGCVIWLTGLSGSGKSTLAQALEKRLFSMGHGSFILDGDNIRRRLNADLGFSDEDRSENIRRVASVAALFADAGLICMASFIAPFREDRQLAREHIGPDRFILVYLSTPLDICEERDPKGLYRKARNGEIADFTGINSPYEKPDHLDVDINTGETSVEKAVEAVIEVMHQKGFI